MDDATKISEIPNREWVVPPPQGMHLIQHVQLEKEKANPLEFLK